MGRPFMPWQQHVLDVVLEIDPATGELWYRDVVVLIPRQSGKTTMTLARVVWRAEAAHLLGGRQTMLYAAQTGTDAKAKWDQDFVEDLNAAAVMKGRYRVIRQANRERIRFRSGSTFGPIATMKNSGHGKTLDDGTVDEAFAQKDNRIEEAWRPAMITRHQAQLWVPSTAGESTLKSPYLWSKAKAGRSIVESGIPSRTAYFEWSAPKDMDPEDPKTWRICMPALGFTIREADIRHEFETIEGGLPAFRRAYLNQWSDHYDDSPWAIPKQSWLACSEPGSRRAPGSRPALGVDRTPDYARSSVSYAAPRSDGLVLGEVIRNGEGSGWLVPEVGKVAREKGASCVTIDGTGPAAALLRALEEELAGVCEVLVLSAAETAAACGTMKEAVVTEQFRHTAQQELTDAVKGAVEIKVGDRFKYGRRVPETDISTIYSVIMACAGLAAQPTSKYEDEGFTQL